jgi:hypothetical protein
MPDKLLFALGQRDFNLDTCQASPSSHSLGLLAIIPLAMQSFLSPQREHQRIPPRNSSPKPLSIARMDGPCVQPDTDKLK